MNWKRGCESAHCVEVAQGNDNLVLVRDSKDPEGPVLAFTPEEWNNFKEGVRNGTFD